MRPGPDRVTQRSTSPDSDPASRGNPCGWPQQSREARLLRGSRYRCLLLTQAPRQTVARLLTQVAEPHATVGSTDFWMPRGFLEPKEARLDRDSGFVANDCQAALRAWWLANPRGANTPNWDIASTCTIGSRKGLLLVEAKAHSNELSDTGKPLHAGASDARRANHVRIGDAIAEANAALNKAYPG